MKKNTNNELADKLGKAVKRIEERKANTFSLYSVRFPRSKERPVCYYGPFMAPSDEVALQSLCEMSKSEPVFQRKNLYCVGSYCSLDGKLKGCSPRLVLGKVKKDEK